MMEGEKIKSHQKGFLKLKCFFFSSQNIYFPFLFEEMLGAFFHAPSLEDSGVLLIFEEKITSSKLLFKWLQYTGDGRIFQNGVMHINMAKP
jgi:hypothetical protein